MQLKTGSEGISFESRFRWPENINSQEIKNDIEQMFIYTKDGIILGCVKTVIHENKVLIGPLAVDNNNQKSGLVHCFWNMQKEWPQ